jgi:alpha-methylacyl-CoA racemase
MILADFGAEVTLVDRPSRGAPEMPNVMERNPFDRGKRSIRVNLKDPEGAEIVRGMTRRADVLLEPFRPGVMERLGLGPEEALAENPRLVYARLTGWGQEGPWASAAGHDIDYIALSGALSLCRREGENPLPPANILGDFAGGGLLCALGILLALAARERTGKGQVVDAAMVDGASYLCTQFYGLLANGLMTLDIGTNMLDGGAPYYQTYETSDGKHMAVGAIEERFYRELLEGLGLDPQDLPGRNDVSRWPETKARFAERFRTRTRDEWTRIFEGRDACVAPVLGLDEAGAHPHNEARGLLVQPGGVTQPAPAPRLSDTPGTAGGPARLRGAETREVLVELGYGEGEIETILKRGVAE